jgi:hypothetical protein
VLAHAQERDEPWAIGMLTLWRRRAGLDDGIAIDPVAARPTSRRSRSWSCSPPPAAHR